ncbi:MULTISPECIES: host cell division inhibitor Icd-like protein [Providencia]
MSIKRSDTTAKLCRIAVIALDQCLARRMLIRDCILFLRGIF